MSEEEQAILATEVAAATHSLPEADRPLLPSGKPDPMRWVQRLKQICQELEVARPEEVQRLLAQMRSALNDLEAALQQHRQGGRPKGKRHKVKATDIEAIRRWEKGESRVGSITDLADALELSRQTVYTILAEIRSAPAQPDVELPRPG